MRYQAILAAVEAGCVSARPLAISPAALADPAPCSVRSDSALPRSALDEADEQSDDDEADAPLGEERDDERSQTKYSVRPPRLPLRACAACVSFEADAQSTLRPPAPPQYTWFHVIFIMASMYVAGLLTDWCVLLYLPLLPLLRIADARSWPSRPQARAPRDRPGRPERCLHRPVPGRHVDARRQLVGLHRPLPLEPVRPPSSPAARSPFAVDDASRLTRPTALARLGSPRSCCPTASATSERPPPLSFLFRAAHFDDEHPRARDARGRPAFAPTCTQSASVGGLEGDLGA